MTTQPTARTPFAGIDKRDADVSFPGWFRDLTDAPAGETHTRATFLQAIGALPKAEKRGVAYWDEQAQEYRKDHHNVAVVNPAWLGDGLDHPDAPNDAVWQVATPRYQCVNPMDVYGPLTAAIRRYNANVGDGEDEHDRPLGDVFGEVREYKLGGEVHLDLVFGGLTVTDPGTKTNDRFVLGIQTGTDHLSGRALYARVVVFDTVEKTVMRNITEKRKRKHTGRAKGDVAEWWTEVLETLEAAAKTILSVVSNARNYTIDFSTLPFGPEGFYTHLGFPEHSLAKTAASRLPQGSTSQVDAWTLYAAVTDVLTNDYEGKDEGSAFASHASLANRILYEPPAAHADALETAEKALRGQQTLSDEDADAADALATKRESITDSLETYTATRDRLVNILNDAAEVATTNGAPA